VAVSDLHPAGRITLDDIDATGVVEGYFHHWLPIPSIAHPGFGDFELID
jgi:hypothetical protein